RISFKVNQATKMPIRPIPTNGQFEMKASARRSHRDSLDLPLEPFCCGADSGLDGTGAGAGTDGDGSCWLCCVAGLGLSCCFWITCQTESTNAAIISAFIAAQLYYKNTLTNYILVVQ